jgi:hypothetical protein
MGFSEREYDLLSEGKPDEILDDSVLVEFPLDDDGCGGKFLIDRYLWKSLQKLFQLFWDILSTFNLSVYEL